jgi:hypothetical protein
VFETSAQYQISLRQQWPKMQALTVALLRSPVVDNDESVRVAAMRACEALSRAMRDAELPFALEHWRWLLGTDVTSSLDESSAGVREHLCGALSTLGARNFAHLERAQQLVCLTLLLGAVSDAVPNVRAAALRALGMFVVFAELRCDVEFVGDVASALLDACDDEISAVRVCAAWSIANLCDTLRTTAATPTASAFNATTTSRDEPRSEDSLLNDLPRGTVLSLLQVVVERLHGGGVCVCVRVLIVCARALVCTETG